MSGAHSRRHLSSAARLGLTLRSVMVEPRAGYASAFRAADRRQRTGKRPPEGWTPYVLAALGGAGAMCAWLKVGALVGWRAVGAGAFDGGMLVGALAVGALLSVAGQLAWGVVGEAVAARLGGEARSRDLRLAWGASAFPLTFVLLLLPLDLVVAGAAAFTSAPVGDSIVTAWAALSLAAGVSLVFWSAWLFARGMEAGTGLWWGRALLVAVSAALCLTLGLVAFAWAGNLVISGAAS
jgi:hypothetical protein